MWTVLLNIIGLISIYFLLRWKIQRSAGVERQIDKIRVQFNDLTVDMNDATSRNMDLLEARIKEAKKLTRQLEKLLAESRESEIRDSLSKPDEEASSRNEKEESGQTQTVASGPVSDALRESVLKLAVRGIPSAEIAEILGCQFQEVEMVLSVSDNRFAKK